MTSQLNCLVAIDIQNDFCDGGALAVPGADEVIPVVNRLIASCDHVVVSQDWHPAGHQSFASAHEYKKPFDVWLAPYGEQVLWPDHCVQGTYGAEIHKSLEAKRAELVLRKGYDPAVDSYSVFFENDRRTPTGLAGYLRERGFRRLFLVGLALDYCIRFSAQDGIGQGFEICVVEDACRPISCGAALGVAIQSMINCGVRRISAGEFMGALSSGEFHQAP